MHANTLFTIAVACLLVNFSYAATDNSNTLERRLSSPVDGLVPGGVTPGGSGSLLDTATGLIGSDSQQGAQPAPGRKKRSIMKKRLVPDVGSLTGGLGGGLLGGQGGLTQGVGVAGLSPLGSSGSAKSAVSKRGLPLVGDVLGSDSSSDSSYNGRNGRGDMRGDNYDDEFTKRDLTGGLLGGLPLLGGGKKGGSGKAGGRGRGKAGGRGRGKAGGRGRGRNQPTRQTSGGGLPLVGGLLKRGTGFPESAKTMGKDILVFDTDAVKTAADKTVKNV